jgi:hypothetical protein
MGPHVQARHARRSRFPFSKSVGPGLHAAIVEMSGRGLSRMHSWFPTSGLLGHPPWRPGRLRKCPGPQYDMCIVWLRHILSSLHPRPTAHSCARTYLCAYTISLKKACLFGQLEAMLKTNISVMSTIILHSL